jgi:hypothetical protein
LLPVVGLGAYGVEAQSLHNEELMIDRSSQELRPFVEDLAERALMTVG